MISTSARAGLPRRFYAIVAVEETREGHVVLLDGKKVRTPARGTLAVPTRGAAETIAAEWEAQHEVIDPATMPMTRLVNTVIDAIAGDPAPVREDFSRYVESDLLFYRAAGPPRLAERQRQLWDPVVAWIEDRLGARFLLAEGVMHVAQPPAALAAFHRDLARIADPFRIGGLHQMTTLTGSAILALAVAEGQIEPDPAWTLAHLDEDWNIEHWGADEEAMARRRQRWEEMSVAAQLARPEQASA